MGRAASCLWHFSRRVRHWHGGRVCSGVEQQLRRVFAAAPSLAVGTHKTKTNTNTKQIGGFFFTFFCVCFLFRCRPCLSSVRCLCRSSVGG